LNWILKPGDTLRFCPLGDGGYHLWIVLDTLYDNPTPAILLVMISTMKKGSERTRRLTSQDHPRIHTDSSVVYWSAKPRNAEQVQSDLNCGNATIREPLSPPLLEMLRDGFLESPRVPTETQARFEALWSQQN
jgi:hypothetical protein